MLRRISGFHQDDAGDWVADLDCHHTQHVRHDPPIWPRPWTLTEAGRQEHLGSVLDCRRCDESEETGDRAPVIDLHVHGPAFVPQPARSLWRIVNPRRPREVGFEALRLGGVDLAVATAVGDPIVTRLSPRHAPWEVVEAQLSRLEAQVAGAGGRVVGSLGAALTAMGEGATAVLLGVEGLDALDGDLERLDDWHGRGVRLGVLVHLRDNGLGSTCLPWQQYRLPVPVRRRRSSGLTAFGAEAVRRMNELGMIVDVAHADTATVLGVVSHATAPVVSTHTGARAVSDFPRYLTDDELRAIASTDGLVGLWPYRGRRWGAATVADLIAHATHVADLVGVDHLAIGTDMNGVPGLATGYRGEIDVPLVLEELGRAGFLPWEVAAIAGGNAARVIGAVETAADH